MKKPSIPKIKRKSAKKPLKSHDANSTRITNETVAEHRERILAGGRKFKYPHQYVRHKLVRNAIIIGVVTLLVAAAAGWQQLYLAQNTSDFAYRVTKVLPVPVSYVDGEMVRYSDYLLRYRSQEMYLRNQGQLGLTGEDVKQQLDYVKRSVMDGLTKDIYAKKRAREMNITVSDQDVQAVVDQQRNTLSGEISQQVYDNSTEHLLGISSSEYRHILKQSLLEQKVAFAADATAQNTKNQIAKVVSGEKGKAPLEKIVKDYKSKGMNLEFGSSGLVPKSNQDGGLAQAAVKLKDGETSEAIEATSGDAYYFVQRESANQRQVSYQYIKIPLTAFDQEYAKLKQQNKIDELINIDASNTKPSSTPQAPANQQKE